MLFSASCGGHCSLHSALSVCPARASSPHRLAPALATFFHLAYQFLPHRGWRGDLQFCLLGVPRETDFLRPLRVLWLKRLETPGLLSGVLSHLVSPSKDPPLSPRVVSLFESDLRNFLHVNSDDVWGKLLQVDAGQPFRLNLWHCLSVICCDPDMDFFRLLREGVPLGIGSPIPPCKVLFPPDSPEEHVIPLQRCDSAWKSALDHADLVDDLLATELREGWIRPVHGGDEELKRRCRRTAVGKLGFVVSPDHPPR